MPDFLVGEQLRLKDCAVALTDQVIAPWLVNGLHPIEVLQPTLVYSPGMAGADLAEWTLREFVGQYLQAAAPREWARLSNAPVHSCGAAIES